MSENKKKASKLAAANGSRKESQALSKENVKAETKEGIGDAESESPKESEDTSKLKEDQKMEEEDKCRSKEGMNDMDAVDGRIEIIDGKDEVIHKKEESGSVRTVEEEDGGPGSPSKASKSTEGKGGGGSEEFEERMEVEEVGVEEGGVDLERWLSWIRVNNSVSSADLDELYVDFSDFKAALKVVQPSAKREGFATVPDVSWEDIGSLADVREELQMNILASVKHPREFEAMGLKAAAGVLLCGPPGCGKTLLAKAVANEAGINFISVKGPELLNMYVGESERAVRQCFQRARNSVPCVIFFDELDALCPKRSDSADGGSSSRIVNQMLTEMDGMDLRKGVYLMAASNRPEIIDSAILRPGRLDKIIYVGIPAPNDRVEILKAITKNGTEPILSQDISLEAIGQSERCHGFTGADLAALVREAGIAALKEFVSSGSTTGSNLMVCEKHFHAAFDKIRPSVSEKDQKYYEKIRRMYSSGHPSIISRFMVEDNESPMESMCSSPLAK